MCEKLSCLGEPWCSEWGCCSTSMGEPPEKRDRKDHAFSPAKSSRFPEPTGSPTMKTICKGYVPRNTDKATSWALRVFNAWRNERNCVSTDKCPENLLESPDVGNLNRWLSRFVDLRIITSCIIIILDNHSAKYAIVECSPFL